MDMYKVLMFAIDGGNQQCDWLSDKAFEADINGNDKEAKNYREQEKELRKEVEEWQNELNKL